MKSINIKIVKIKRNERENRLNKWQEKGEHKKGAASRIWVKKIWTQETICYWREGFGIIGKN